MDDDDQMVRLSVNLSPEVAAELEAYMDRKQVSATEAVRRALSILAELGKAHDRGVTVYFEENGKLNEILFLA